MPTRYSVVDTFHDRGTRTDRQTDETRFPDGLFWPKQMVANVARWEQWLADTLITDIVETETPDPVPLLEKTEDGLTTSDKLGSYKWGKNDGEYLYLLYLLDGDGTDPGDVVPVYIGESTDISSRLGQHSRKIRESLPLEAWAGDGSWGSFSKYDHMAAVHEQAPSPLYAWIYELGENTRGPYGHPTYRQELEAKLVGLVQSLEQYDRVFANREFVPNKTLYEIGQAGPDWTAEGQPTSEQVTTSGQLRHEPTASKEELWNDWLDSYLLSDLHSKDTNDPIELFETDGSGQVRLTDSGRLARSDTIDDRIRREGRKCVDETGVRDDGYEGLLYIMYQLAAPVAEATPADIIPRYIGKAEAYGKKRRLSSNFTEIAQNRTATQSFARWGDGDYWHIGELSMSLLGDDERKQHWADALFESASRRLSQPTYLCVHAWHSETDTGPYGLPLTLAAVEPLLIGLAHAASPEALLNQEGVPSTES